MSNRQALSEFEIHERLQKLPEWRYENNMITRVKNTETYLDALELLYEIGQRAEVADHHPDLLLNWCKLTIRYATHETDQGQPGITPLDFECAKDVESLLK